MITITIRPNAGAAIRAGRSNIESTKVSITDHDLASWTEAQRDALARHVAAERRWNEHLGAAWVTEATAAVVARLLDERRHEIEAEDAAEAAQRRLVLEALSAYREAPVAQLYRQHEGRWVLLREADVAEGGSTIETVAEAVGRATESTAYREEQVVVATAALRDCPIEHVADELERAKESGWVSLDLWGALELVARREEFVGYRDLAVTAEREEARRAISAWLPEPEAAAWLAGQLRESERYRVLALAVEERLPGWRLVDSDESICDDPSEEQWTLNAAQTASAQARGREIAGILEPHVPSWGDIEVVPVVIGDAVAQRIEVDLRRRLSHGMGLEGVRWTCYVRHDQEAPCTP